MSWKGFVALLAVLCMPGCQREPQMAAPISGTVMDGGLFLGQFTVKRPDSTPKSWSLSKRQLDGTYAWLQSHKVDWGMVLASPPPPSYSVILVDADRHRIQIDLYSASESWRRAVGIFMSDSGGKLIFRGQTSLPPEAIESLTNLLSTERSAGKAG